jgi:hypothetical protein
LDLGSATLIEQELSDIKKNMKHLISALALGLLAIGPMACGKNHVPGNLALLRHKWNIVSLNGEALRYVGQPGDYYDFRNDSLLYIHYGSQNDTLIYLLINGGNVLQLYGIQNGQRFGTPTEWDVEELNTSSFILRDCNNHPFCAVDSLSR